MWINVNGKLVSVTDESRVDYKTRISKAILDDLMELAEKYDTLPNYLIETGMENVLNDGIVQFDKSKRAKDRVYYKSSYNNEILRQIKQMADDHKLTYSDMIEYCCQFIEPGRAKPKNYRHRIE